MNKSRRVDIDTLRGLSVISVIIYHLDSSLFPYGYLGVDLFFVISGYLITKSIISDYKLKKFKFTEFYLRRIKRILPVLLTVLLFSFLFAVIILLTNDLKKFSESLLTSLSFVSNIYFWITGGYFSTNDQLKPLLHLWSLSVEEQFYVFFPLFLYIVFKTIKKFNFKILIILLIIIFSFSLNLFSIFKGYNDAIFFLFPARIWQFGIGSLFAFFPNLKIKNMWIDTIYLFFAISLIIINFLFQPVFLPNGSLMCLGASLILYKSINQNNFFSNIFKIQPLIFIGLISYSLYLWHWPVISFLKYIYIDELTSELMVVSLIMISVLSILSWKFIEQPFLYKYSNKKILSYVSIGYIILIISSLIILNSNNLPSRYGKLPNQIADAVDSNYRCSKNLEKIILFGDGYACYINNKVEDSVKSILYGNSHALMYGWAYRSSLILNNQKGITAGLNGGCLPFIDVNRSLKCLKKAKLFYNSIINSKDIKNVIIGLTWYSNILVDEQNKVYADDDFKIRRKSLNFLIDSLKKNNKNVYLIGPIEIPGIDFPSKLSREMIFKKRKNIELFKNKDDFTKTYLKEIKYFEDKLFDNFIQPHKELCDEVNCYFTDKKGSFFSDSNHLSYYGSIKMKKLFKNIN
jgi:peptidoglycan/LPS O-acetylase OafA/YrhL